MGHAAAFLLRADGGTQTLDPRFARAVLYELSYVGEACDELNRQTPSFAPIRAMIAAVRAYG